MQYRKYIDRNLLTSEEKIKRRKLLKKEYNKKWRNNNKKHCEKYAKKYYTIHREQNREWHKKHSKKILKNWEGFIPKETNCQICNTKIYFNNGDTKNAIHFDHTNDCNLINYQPTIWLRNNKRTKKTEDIWKKCNFGMLCIRCNSYLPTKNRHVFVDNLIKYVKGIKNEEKR